MIIDISCYPTDLVDLAWRHDGDPFTGERLLEIAEVGIAGARVVEAAGIAVFESACEEHGRDDGAGLLAPVQTGMDGLRFKMFAGVRG